MHLPAHCKECHCQPMTKEKDCCFSNEGQCSREILEALHVEREGDWCVSKAPVALGEKEILYLDSTLYICVLLWRYSACRWFVFFSRVFLHTFILVMIILSTYPDCSTAQTLWYVTWQGRLLLCLCLPIIIYFLFSACVVSSLVLVCSYAVIFLKSDEPLNSQSFSSNAERQLRVCQ